MALHNRCLTYYIETFGCQMNERDSQTIEGLLREKGLSQSPRADDADVVVVNTCAVRQSAEAKVWSRLGQIAASSKYGKLPVIVLAGCMAQIPETIERIRNRVPYVRIVTGPGQLDKIPGLVELAVNDESGKLLTAVSPRRSESHRSHSTQMLPEKLPRTKVPGLSAYVTIMYGCDNFCTYCIVPFVRGPQVSRKPQHVIEEVEELASRGYTEITLLGQNVNAYGMDLNDQYGFSELLQGLDHIPGLHRIRYFTSHPRDFSREMVDTIKNSRHICEHFHLPVQSGNNRMLKLMHRGYTREQYLELVDYIRSQIPEASITTDIIVGFPGETDEEFQDTIDLVKSVGFDGAFTFIYSPRTGTSAAKMEGQIPRNIKSQRLQNLVEVQNEITKAINNSLVGSVQEILIEGPDPKNPGYSRGRTRTNKLVVCTSENLEIGDLVKARIEEAGTWYLKGPLLKD
ncbi:MAG: tRNA (N6-isopentenyl adenosine(37)-C2)-methylthiotransferase MiaB [Bacillota bacterium]